MVRTFTFALFIIILTTCGCSPSINNLTPTSTKCNTSLPALGTSSPVKMTTQQALLLTPSQTLLQSDISLTKIIREIRDCPDQYADKQVEIVGYFHGWDLLHEIQTGPPMTRSDWVIADHSGAIYVTGLAPKDLNPASREDTIRIIRLVATVEQNQHGVYLQAVSVELIFTE